MTHTCDENNRLGWISTSNLLQQHSAYVPLRMNYGTSQCEQAERGAANAANGVPSRYSGNVSGMKQHYQPISFKSTAHNCQYRLPRTAATSSYKLQHARFSLTTASDKLQKHTAQLELSRSNRPTWLPGLLKPRDIFCGTTICSYCLLHGCPCTCG